MNAAEITAILERFPSCACDRSGEIWPEEAEVVESLLRGNRIVEQRHYVEPIDDYAVSFCWVEPDGRMEYPTCRDSVVFRLLGREVLKPITCSGGYTTLEFTRAAEAAFGHTTARPPHSELLSIGAAIERREMEKERAKTPRTTMIPKKCADVRNSTC